MGANSPLVVASSLTGSRWPSGSRSGIGRMNLLIATSTGPRPCSGNDRLRLFDFLLHELEQGLGPETRHRPSIHEKCRGALHLEFDHVFAVLAQHFVGLGRARIAPRAPEIQPALAGDFPGDFNTGRVMRGPFRLTLE